MSHTQLTQDERYPIQYLSLHCTVTEKAQRQTNLGFRRPFAIDASRLKYLA
ncbi:hypothetical protein NEISICOT_00328 [Neisseria sicca ATCC 29256]|uniref:Uncharacterized protein n=1 Tax=Neisseria sicca ATCC 29256 TaxID=547045 RepID=C6M1E8_NEISI|nr:hypothetical protein NEISICOT_00328 [Neisseria sicca ATCC 29256]